METSINEIRFFTLEIPYANTTARNNAKKIGATWNPSLKVWTIETSESKLRMRNIDRFIKQDAAAVASLEKAPSYLDLGVGFPVANNPKSIADVHKYGFDAIERMG